MPDIDQWLAEAGRHTAVPPPGAALEAIECRIGAEPDPLALSARRDARRTMLCAGVAAVFGFGVTGASATIAFSRPAMTWVAAPSASSPFVLLVGR